MQYGRIIIVLLLVDVINCCTLSCLVHHSEAKGRNWQGFQPGPDSFAEEASRQARALGSCADFGSLSAADVNVTLSQDFKHDRPFPQGVGSCDSLTTVPWLPHS